MQKASCFTLVVKKCRKAPLASLRGRANARTRSRLRLAARCMHTWPDSKRELAFHRYNAQRSNCGSHSKASMYTTPRSPRSRPHDCAHIYTPLRVQPLLLFLDSRDWFLRRPCLRVRGRLASYAGSRVSAEIGAACFTIELQLAAAVRDSWAPKGRRTCRVYNLR